MVFDQISPKSVPMTRALHFGDNLEVLRDSIADDSVDLIYLDPPFNSKRAYNLLFKSPTGHQSDAQITAFEDTWHWGPQAQREFDELLHQPNTHVAEMMRAFRAFLGENDVMAYLTMMANRLLELHRVLKPTGSLYLHCDPTASHYLKIVLDGVFGKENYRSEISWKRSSAHSDAKQGRRIYGNIRDVVFFYTKSSDWTWNWIYTAYDQYYIETFYKHIEEGTGRRYQADNLTAAKPGGDTIYEWRVKRKGNGPWGADLNEEFRNPKNGWEYKGVGPYKGRYWAYSHANMQKFARDGRLIHASSGIPRYKRYLDEMPGVPLQNDWDDIRHATGNEHLGYPTQKPLALLLRIIEASSNEGDVVLDPFCGCGTAVHAAELLKRQWIGIDITHLAISLIEKRLRDAFPGIDFEVQGVPEDFAGAQDLARRGKYQFQWWACSLVNAQPYQGKKKGADRGIDGLIFFRDDNKGSKKIVVSVKGGDNVEVGMIRDLIGVMQRDGAEIGLFVTLAEPTGPMINEAATAGLYDSKAYGRKFPRLQILTVKGLLGGNERPEYINVDAELGFKRAKRETTAHRGNVELELNE